MTTDLNRFRPNRFRILAALAGLLALAGVDRARAVEFSGPIVVPWNDDVVCGTVVPTLDGARQQVVVGTTVGWVRLLRPAGTFAETFNFQGQMFVGGRVVSMVAWEGRPVASPGVVLCTADPDRLIFAEVLGSYPYLRQVDAIDLVEDPGSIAVLDDPAGEMNNVAVSLPGIDAITIAREEGGAWSLGPTLAAGDRPTSIVALDLDEDPERELVSANEGVLSRSLGRYDRQADGSYRLERTLPVDGAPRQALVRDWDRDGSSEVVVALEDSARVVVFDATGDALIERDRVELPFVPGHVALAEVPGGWTAVFSCARDRRLLDYRTAGGSGPQATYYPGGPAVAVLPCDFNGDSIPDLAVLGGAAQYASIQYGRPDASYWAYPALDLPSTAGAAILAEMDGDGRADLVVAGFGTSELSFHRRGEGGFEFEPRFTPLGYLPGVLAAIQLDADAEHELAVYDLGSGRVHLYELDAEGTFVALGRFDAESSWSGLLAADLDHDGLEDLLGYSRSTRSIAAYFGQGGGSFTGRFDWTLGQPIHELTCLDLDDDGLLEIVHSDGVSKVWFAPNLTGRELGEPDWVYAGAEAAELATGDLDADGDADIAVGNVADNSLSLLENPGTGELVRRVGSFSLEAGFSDVLCAEVDDLPPQEVLLLQRNTRTVGISYALGDWQFAPTLDYPLHGSPYRLLAVGREGGGPADLLALDNINDLGYVLPNAERTIVAVDPLSLQVRCDGEDVEIRVRPDRPGPWRLDLVTGAETIGIATASEVRLGSRQYERGEWRHRLPVGALPRPEAAATARVRLTMGGTVVGESVERPWPAGCGGEAPSPGDLAWIRRPGPNPFNPSVSCALRLPRAADLTVDVYDVAGRHVRRLAAGRHEAGEHVFVWSGDGPRGRAAAGTYFLLARTGSAQLISKVLLLK